MRVPFVKFSDIYTQNKDEILGALDRVFSNGELCLGDYGKDMVELEKWFAEFIGVKHAIMVGSGTQALYLAYKALGIGPGDEVITTAHTFSATFDQIIALGATPILVDIGSETGLIDPKEIEKAITPKTKAIVPVHLEGKVCDMDAIMKLANKYKLKVIEDAAQAIGAIDVNYTKCEDLKSCIGKGLKVGTIGDLGCFSLYPAKIFGTLGNAGMITTNDDELAYKVSMLRCNYRFEKDPEKVNYGFNFEPDNAWAAVLNVRKKYLSEYLKRREEIAGTYLRGLQELENRGLIKLSWNQPGRVWQDFVIRINHPKDKEELLTHLTSNGVGFLGHDVPHYPDYPKLNLKFDLPKTREYIKQQVRIPCNPYLKDEEVEYIIATLLAFWK